MIITQKKVVNYYSDFGSGLTNKGILAKHDAFVRDGWRVTACSTVGFTEVEYTRETEVTPELIVAEVKEYLETGKSDVLDKLACDIGWLNANGLIGPLRGIYQQVKEGKE